MIEDQDARLPDTEKKFGWPYGIAHMEVHSLLWMAIVALQNADDAENSPFQNILVEDSLEISSDTGSTLVLSPKNKSKAYSSIAISRHMSGSLAIEMVSYNDDHTHSVSTLLLEVNLASGRVKLGTFHVPLETANVPILTGILDDPSGAPVSAETMAQVINILADAGLLVNKVTRAPAES